MKNRMKIIVDTIELRRASDAMAQCASAIKAALQKMNKALLPYSDHGVPSIPDKNIPPMPKCKKPTLEDQYKNIELEGEAYRWRVVREILTKFDCPCEPATVVHTFLQKQKINLKEAQHAWKTYMDIVRAICRIFDADIEKPDCTHYDDVVAKVSMAYRIAKEHGFLEEVKGIWKIDGPSPSPPNREG